MKKTLIWGALIVSLTLVGAFVIARIADKRGGEVLVAAPGTAIESYNEIAAAALKDEWDMVYSGYSASRRKEIDATMEILISIDSFSNGKSPFARLSSMDRYVSYMLASPHKAIVQNQFGSVIESDTLNDTIYLTVKNKKNQYKIAMIQEGVNWRINKVVAQ